MEPGELTASGQQLEASEQPVQGAWEAQLRHWQILQVGVCVCPVGQPDWLP